MSPLYIKGFAIALAGAGLFVSLLAGKEKKIDLPKADNKTPLPDKKKLKPKTKVNENVKEKENTAENTGENDSAPESAENEEGGNTAESA